MSSIVVLLPEELSTRYNGCPMKMIGYRPEISLKKRQWVVWPAPNKRSRIVTDDAMNVDITSPSASAPTLTSTVPSGLPVNKVQVFTSPQNTTTPVETVDVSIHAPTNTNGKGKTVAFDVPERRPSPDGNAAAIKSAPSRYYAAAYLRDAPDAFKTKFTTNRSMCDEVDCSLSHYSSYGTRARCDGSGDNKKILVFFFDQHDFTDCVSSPRADLLDLVFSHYSPADAKLSDEMKSLFVTDIPLFLTETQVRQAFSRYGTVVKCKLTPKKHYYNGHIQFTCADAVTQFNDIWAIICLGNSLRVCPASFSKSQRDSRREHVAILAGIPKNIKEADLLEIATQVNAKALNVLLSINSYKPKPYVYLNFSSFESLEAAKEMTVAFRGKGLTWHSPNDAQTLCHVCGRPGCSPSICNPRTTRKSRDNSNSHSRSRSNSRSRNNNSSSFRSNNSNNNSNSSRPNTSRSSNRPNNNNNNPRNNENSSGPTQPPHRPHPIISTTPTSSSDNPAPTLPQHVIDELKAQIKEIANTLHTLEETVSWMNDTITSHEYRLSELESMMNYDAPGDSELHSPQDAHEHYNHSYDNGWDDAPTQDTNSGFNLPPHTSSSLMDVSPDASFSALDPSSVLSKRHVPLPASRPTNIAPDASTSRLQSEIFNGFHLPTSAKLDTNSLNNPSSSSLPSPLINFGQINVNGLCSPVRQLHLLNYFLHSSFGVLSLNDTRLTSSGAKFIYQNEHSLHNFKSYWAPSPSNSRPHDGVSLLLRHPLHKHVQKIDPWNGRLLKLDLFFHQTKISIISVYIPPYHSIHYKERDAIFAQLNLWLDKARSNNYHVVILGDFNADENSHSHLPQHHLKILRSLSSRYFTDHQSHISSTSGPSPTFYHPNGFSKLDYIWSSPGFPAPGLFSQVETCPKLNDNQFTDHRVLITAFDFSSCFATLSKARLKQKSEQRTIFLYKNLNEDIWDTFSNEVNSRLELYLTTHHPSISSLSALSLDKLWHALKRSILGGAIDSLPFQHVSNTHHHKYPPELTMLIAINKFLDRLLFKLTTSRPSRPAQISQLINSLPTQLILLKSLLSDYTIPSYSITPLPTFVKFLRSQKALVSAYLSTQFHQHRVDSIEYYTALRDEHFSTSPGSFISSALSVEHRSIVLDRVLVVIDSKPTLLTDSSVIKQAAIKHFQSVVTPPLVQYSSTDLFPSRWQRAYTPLSDIDSSLYNSVMSPILADEWKNTLNSMPNNKASANACLIHGNIPADWREALVYPIPKPHEFDAQLKNTWPITLLETVRKCGSTNVPIKMLDAIIHQRRFDRTDDQELWIVSQDISKAFDSIDLNMLRLALIRLHIPSLLIKFIINLFTRRNNKIITHHGDTSGYRVRIGIDQGEIISLLLWVIYLDPLLTTLNREACDPFILKSSALLDYSPIEYEQYNLPISHITFMDDSTLIASSKRGIEDRLSITAEFYTLNNTQANSAKYILLSSEQFSQNITFDLSPSFLISNPTLTLKALALSTSFRFLGVWFCLSASSRFVYNQTVSMVKDMAALLSPKKLLAQHVAYFYNIVLLLRLEFRLQSTLFAESTINRMVSPMLSLIRQKAGLASVTPLSTLFTLLPFSIQQAFGRFLSSHVASWQKIFSHPSYKLFANYMITYLQGFLDCDACPSTIDLEPWSHTFPLRTHSLFNSLLFSSRLNITCQNYWFNPQWAISFNRNTNSFLVGRVITTYPAPRNEALISHWIASSVDDLLSDFTACQGCASALPRSSTSKTLLKRCPSEKCFSYVSLSTLIRYPTKPRTYIHADTRSVSLSASLGYAKSLLLFHLFAPDRLPSTNEQVPRISDIQLPSSVSTLYIDGSFLSPPSHPVSSMAFAWTAIDPDGFILESHYNNISSIFPSALRSEVFALLHGLDSLPRDSKITVATDCAQLLSLWSLYVDAPFIPKLLKEPNHLLWSSIRTIMSQKKLDVSLLKVPAHSDDPLNNHVDALAKAAHTDSHLSSHPSLELLAPCILQFNSLLVDMNIRKFIRDIFDAKSLLTLAVLPRFNSFSSTSDIDWACTKFYHLWTCPYILPEFSPLITFKTLLLALRANCLDKFISASPLLPLPDSFVADFMALDCWDCDPPSFSCLRLARELIPISLTEFLGNYFSSLTIWFILDTPLHDFHFDLYVQIWLCRSIFFHHWESAQGITKKLKSFLGFLVQPLLRISFCPAPTPTSTVPSGLPVNKVQVITSPHTTTTPVETVDASIHAPSNTDGKGKAVAFDIPERQPSPDGNAAAIKSASTRYHAAAYLRDAPDAFKTKFTTNRSMCDEVDCSLSRYSSYGARARCDGSGDNKKILVFFNDQHDYTDCVSSPRADLLNLAFTHYSPADAKLNDEAKSLFVTDIPLFLNETQVRQAFFRYGTVIKCKLTPKKHYYNGHIQFSSADAITQFNDIWAIICLGNSLRVCPASFSKSQRDSRREHVAILVGIPKNIKEADLLEIATQVNAKALNVPLSINSYKPKPYAYLNFSSFDTLEAAKEMTVAFRGKGLTWHPPNKAHTLCHVCGRPGCSPSVCNPRSTRKVDDRLNKLYSRFNAGPKRGRQDSRQSRDKSNSRSRSRSNSRSRNNSSFSSRFNNSNNNTNTSHPNTSRRSNQTNNNNYNPKNNENSFGSTQPPLVPHPISSTHTSSSDNSAYTLPQHIIDELKAQIKEIATTLKSLDETVSWMQDTITHHDYRISELESMMNYDNNNSGDSDLYPPHNDHETHSYDNGWDDVTAHDTNSGFNLPPHTSPSLMDTSPDASFSTLDPNSVLSRRHVPLPNSRHTIIAPDANASRLQLEISNGLHPPDSVLPDNLNNSIYPSSPSPLIKFGQLNVNGLCSPVRQLHLLNYFLHSSFGVLSLNDTRLTSSSAKFIYQTEHSQHNFKSYWAPSPSNSRPHDGVGLLLRHPLHKHVQKIDPWKGRLLKLDLFFHQTKISIISVYISSYHSIHYKERDAIFAQLNLWLDNARSNNYHVVILGSSPTFYYPNGSSRLDYIWSSPGFPAPGLFSHVETCPKLNDNQFTDHHVLITAFDFSSCFATLAKARLKQKSEQRTIFLYKNIKEDSWMTFSNEVNSRLELYLATHYPSLSSLSVLPLDKLWHALKRSILGGAIDSLPFQHVSNTHHHKYPPELTMLITINKFLDRLLFKLTTSRPSHPAQISQMINSLPTQLTLLKSLLKDYTIPIYNTTPLPAFIKFLRSQKALVSAYLSTQFHQHRVNSIEYYTALRDEYFSTSPGSFISLALSVEHRSIVLDRVLVVIDSKPTLLTDPTYIKQAAIKHFQSVVTPPLVQYSSTDSFPPRWQRAYTPLSGIDSSLYNSVMSPILEDEWTSTLHSMPNNKASGPSKISYEMLKHLTGEAFNLSLILANACLNQGDIPADWREALVYPIPKPHEFDAQLKNTQPITLLETVRKCVVKVVTTRLSKILADNQVLQGGNFAGLPGGSTDIPIKMLDAIIHQRRFDKSDDQELWIVSQDISKAFDAIDLNMLRLALIRLHIPSLLIKFIINLFTRRNNKIITHHGDTSGYRVRIGIDQGEIISPLLWVIYLDPLLATLNREACDPFILKSSALLDYSPIEYEQHNLPVSHITFMDDSTLIASSKRGIEDRLSITAEFYTLNNTQANSAKYILLSSKQFSQNITFDLSFSPLIASHTLTLKALALSTSFRFLGVWFNLSASSRFVHNQTVSMVKDMAALLSPKKLLAQHVAYLYNIVLLPRLEFRLQSTLFAESTINRMVSPMLSLIRQKAGLASVTPLPALFTLLPFSIQQAFGRFLSSHVASWQKIFSHPSYKLFANYMITYLQGFLDCDACPSTIDLEPWSHTSSLRTHSLFNSFLFSSRLNITWSLLF
ncbi:RNA-directed DNA polymerase from mobile element jockey-like [Rhizophagus irregularis DAOM 181602=DAOM 197198]|nr:RNA-directed DNA polymerase from mobile element jockey-like [Rhizophagus irregularis DAOM 181602=DAOM 197198]